MNEYKPGDILLTRNTEEVGNNSNKGHYNHSSILTAEGVVEAQDEPKAVILVTLESFLIRYPEILILRHRDENIAAKASKEAEKLIGRPYKRAASVFFSTRNRGENCVSVCRRAFLLASGQDYQWRIPDDIYNCRDFDIYEQILTYDKWVQPKTWFEGRIR